MKDSLFTDADGHFTSPVMAAAHATIVQHGYSTPKREAARMLLDGGVHEERARAWMAAENLTDGDLEWDPGQLDRYQARQQPDPAAQPQAEPERN